MKARRRTKRSLRGRLRSYWIIAAILIAGVSYGVYRAVQWPGFAVKRIDISGLRVTTRNDILHVASIHLGRNIWLQNLGRARSRIEALPYVKTVTLRRIPPGTVAIAVAERAPDGCLVGELGERALVDIEGRVLQGDCGTQTLAEYRVPTLHVPEPGAFVHDEGLSRLQTDAHALSSDGHGFSSFSYDRFGDVDATLPSGIVVQFGAEGDLQEKARLVEPILHQFAAKVSTIAAIDLRAADTPVVRYRSPAPAPTSSP